jgi:hypothetical protein
MIFKKQITKLIETICVKKICFNIFMLFFMVIEKLKKD